MDGDRQLIFSNVQRERNTYVIADLDKGTTQRLIQGMAAWDANVSRDRQRIAFMSDASGQAQVWIANGDGSDPRQLTFGDASGQPAFSADGKHVYVVAARGQLGYRVAVDGRSDLVPVTSVPTNRIYPSPDGRWLLARLRSTESDGGPLWRTALIPAGSSKPTRFFDVPRYAARPQFVWHPDSKGFFYIDTKDGVGNLWLQRLDGTEPKQVTFFTSGAIFSYDIGRDGKSLALSRGEPTSDAVLIRNWR